MTREEKALRSLARMGVRCVTVHVDDGDFVCGHVDGDPKMGFTRESLAEVMEACAEAVELARLRVREERQNPSDN